MPNYAYYKFTPCPPELELAKRRSPVKVAPVKENVAKLLIAFEALPQKEQQVFFRELLRRLSVVDVRERGIDAAEASDMRARLDSFAEDWNRG
jgi:hypothetical protein